MCKMCDEDLGAEQVVDKTYADAKKWASQWVVKLMEADEEPITGASAAALLLGGLVASGGVSMHTAMGLVKAAIEHCVATAREQGTTIDALASVAHTKKSERN